LPSERTQDSVPAASLVIANEDKLHTNEDKRKLGVLRKWLAVCCM